MAITVSSEGFENTDYPDGTKWVIDESGRLHVIGEKGNLSSYNVGAWLSVHQIDPSERELKASKFS